MKLFKQKYTENLTQFKEELKDSLAAGSAKDYTEYKRLVGMIYAIEKCEDSFDEMWRKFVENEGNYD